MERLRPWNPGRGSTFFVMDMSSEGSALMKRVQPVSIFSQGWTTGRAAAASLALLCLLASPARSPAQDAGVSGIAPGPANARGLNGTINDPSGIGNAAKVAPIPPPSMAAPVVPSASPSGAYRSPPVGGVSRIRRTRFAATRYRRAGKHQEAIDRAAVKENDRLLDHKLLSICRGC
jgi:hypothetical protein